jgi:hypothetical protein
LKQYNFLDKRPRVILFTFSSLRIFLYSSHFLSLTCKYAPLSPEIPSIYVLTLRDRYICVSSQIHRHHGLGIERWVSTSSIMAKCHRLS